MTTLEQVKQCKNAKEACLVLAQAIDELKAKGNGWEGGWDSEPLIVRGDNDAIAAELKKRIETLAGSQLESDVEERASLEARLRLLQDVHVDTDQAAHDSKITEIETKDGVVIQVPTASDSRQAARQQWVIDIGLAAGTLDVASTSEAFAKGGPLWLHTYDRPTVMSMPVEQRQLLVKDLAEDSAQDAIELGSDILKDTQPGTPELTVDALARTAR